MKIIFKISLLLAFFSTSFQFCKSKTIVENTDVYSVVYKSFIGGKKEKSTIIITNYEEFNALVSQLNIDETEYEKLVSIDLEKHNIVASFMGEKTTGGFDIDVNEVKFFPTKVEVSFKEKVPEKNEMVTMAFTSPYIFVALPKNKEIVLK